MTQKGEYVHISRAIGDWLQESGLLSQPARAELERAWRAAAGRTIASQTRLIGLRREQLWVQVGSAPLRAELEGFRKAELLARLRQEYTRRHISGIRFLVCGTEPGLSDPPGSGG